MIQLIEGGHFRWLKVSHPSAMIRLDGDRATDALETVAAGGLVYLARITPTVLDTFDEMVRRLKSARAAGRPAQGLILHDDLRIRGPDAATTRSRRDTIAATLPPSLAERLARSGLSGPHPLGGKVRCDVLVLPERRVRNRGYKRARRLAERFDACEEREAFVRAEGYGVVHMTSGSSTKPTTTAYLVSEATMNLSEGLPGVTLMHNGAVKCPSIIMAIRRKAARLFGAGHYTAIYAVEDDAAIEGKLRDGAILHATDGPYAFRQYEHIILDRGRVRCERFKPDDLNPKARPSWSDLLNHARSLAPSLRAGSGAALEIPAGSRADGQPGQPGGHR